MFWALTSLLTACSGTSTQDDDTSVVDDDGCSAEGVPDLVVGIGENEFGLAADGDGTTELIHGPQGGYHTYVALQARNIDAGKPLTAVMEGFIDGNLTARSVPYVTFRCNPEVNAQEAWGLLLIWDAEPEELHQQHALVEVTVTDANGESASANGEVDIFDPIVEGQ